MSVRRRTDLLSLILFLLVPRYRPKDISSNDFVAAMKPLSERANRSSPDTMKNKFASLQKKFQPIFRHYFTERHKDPMSWFTMRLNYARSVATTSMVGHVVGLGDRHLANILLDQTTGELVHIDFGIAFDQVSFRLSFSLLFSVSSPFRHRS